MLKSGTQIVYVPNHAEGDLNHYDCEIGFVMRDQKDGSDSVFCRYWRKGLAGIELRTKANSELTPIDNIIVMDSVPQQLVRDAINEVLKNG